MALATRLSTRATRRAIEAEGKRFDEIGATTDIGTTYAAVDRAGDLEMEDQFKRLFVVADDDEERSAVVAAYMAWDRTERREGVAVESSVEDAVALLRTNNDFWLADGCGPDGRAA